MTSIIRTAMVALALSLQPLAPAYAAESESTSHSEHADHDEETLVKMTPEQMARAGIVIETAAQGKVTSTLELSGQIVLNADREAHITPRIGGVIKEVRKVLGDEVAAGETLALIESGGLADFNAAYLAAISRTALAQETYAREESLWRQKISAEVDYLAAKQRLAEAHIDERQARQKLKALGFTANDLEALAKRREDTLTQYAIVSSTAGTVVEKHVTLGEVVEPGEMLYTIADLSTVWVDLNVYTKDLPFVTVGQTAEITIPSSATKITGKVAYVQPLANTETRAILARVVLDNADKRWRPGLFVSAHVKTSDVEVPVLIAREAVQTVENATVVFVAEASGLEARPVTLGRGDSQSVEIIEGLRAGERYVAANSFIIKSELGKGEADHAH